MKFEDGLSRLLDLDQGLAILFSNSGRFEAAAKVSSTLVESNNNKIA